ncbi:uncharacterized mitochondrial protein-like protein [Tanacetum coccineum]
MNYQHVTAENKAKKTVGPKEANHNAGTQDNIDAGNSKMEVKPAQEYFVPPLWSSYTSIVKRSQPQHSSRTESNTKSSEAHAFVSYIQKQRRNNHKDFQHCLFACFLSQIEPKKISQALEEESWVDAMHGRAKSWCDDFEALMKSRFQMCSMGELTFFLRLQVKQKEDGIFISQDKYVAEILKKFDFASVKIASTPIETRSIDKDGRKLANVDVQLYYDSMIVALNVLDCFKA